MKKPRPRWISFPADQLKKRPLAQSPGSLVHRGTRQVDTTDLRLIEYDQSGCKLSQLTTIPKEGITTDPGKVTWLHFTGLHEVDEISAIGRIFGVSNLILEDILNTGSRSKIEIRDTDLFVVAKLITSDEPRHLIQVQHFSLLLLPGNVVLTFAETPTHAFDPVIQRIQTNAGGRIRSHKSDYLAWAILDAVVDHYLFLIDQMQDSVNTMDERLQQDTMDINTSELYNLKRDISRLQRAIRPIREIAGSLLREPSDLISRGCHPFLSDLNDHAIQCIEMTEDLKESSIALRDFYLSAVSNRMNEVMKVLTCFSTIFLPLTFLAGVYGMNFEHIPELSLPWGYQAVWVVFILCAAGMFWLFRRMKWL